MDALRQVEGWPAETVAVGVLRDGEEVATQGPREHVFRWASITKPVTALATLVAAEEGIVDLDEPAGPPGSTLRHLLAHASGLPFEGLTPIAQPGRRRIYSNGGFDVIAETVAAAAEMPFTEYLEAAVLQPLGMQAELRGSATSELHGTLDDLLRGRDDQRTVVVPVGDQDVARDDARVDRRQAEGSRGDARRPDRVPVRMRTSWGLYSSRLRGRAVAAPCQQERSEGCGEGDAQAP